MTDLPAVPGPSFRLPAIPEPPPLDRLLSASGPAFMGVFDPYRSSRDPETLRKAVAGGERLLAGAASLDRQLAEAIEPESAQDIGRQLQAFVEAWPNASRGDLAGYGAQLALDVAERQPCRYALRSALRYLRQTSRFLPSIAEVLAALDDAQGRIRNTSWHLQEFPTYLARARVDLAQAEAREARGAPDQAGGAP